LEGKKTKSNDKQYYSYWLHSSVLQLEMHEIRRRTMQRENVQKKEAGN
jgi:hypothetical protein